MHRILSLSALAALAGNMGSLAFQLSAGLNLVPAQFRSPNSQRACRSISMQASSSLGSVAAPYKEYLLETAKVPESTIPARLGTLLTLLNQIQGQEMVDVSSRKGLHPLFVPLTKKDDVYTGILRWPTAPENLPLPIVKTSGEGLSLYSPDPEHLIRRLVAEADAAEREDIDDIIALGNEGLQGALYEKGSVAGLKVGVEKYLLLRVGPFPDVFEQLALDHRSKGSDQSALVAAERANEVFKGWARPYSFYASLLHEIGGRNQESKDAAKVAMRMPLWTAAYDRESMVKLTKLAGYSELASVQKMYQNLVEDKQEGKITEGKAPAQAALDRTAYVMDAVMLGNRDLEGGWDSIREDLAELYEEGGIPELATFVKSC
eukprot:CAMPEP_0113936164 /NCGR_PEP_ID=MMETSP1339-20121228/3130_1 /TAXON_ID=94617 /ORGANISM="Fibrocapsa japonica" /LENGTH=375 /DNA_ID=CAMNT_0000938533 /DNA_START=56 /DNA_END=1183 /DNA_ORIENTATION=+ /assembly_acc=CAM_ASM_000762